ncbi:MAG: hypothetical protein JXR63_00520 [Spirochaetales bacterium]|nr:hypothetical protein [Spirochaetales bacterium]
MKIKGVRNIYFWGLFVFTILYFLVVGIVGLRLGLDAFVTVEMVEDYDNSINNFTLIREFEIPEECNAFDIEGVWYVKVVDSDSREVKVFAYSEGLDVATTYLQVIDAGLSRVKISNSKDGQTKFQSMLLEVPVALLSTRDLRFAGLSVLSFDEGLVIPDFQVQNEGALKIMGKDNSVELFEIRSQGLLLFALPDLDVATIDIVSEGFSAGDLFVEDSSGTIILDGFSSFRTHGAAASLEIISSGMSFFRNF